MSDLFDMKRIFSINATVRETIFKITGPDRHFRRLEDVIIKKIEEFENCIY